ncbi:MAG: hypothetical protein QF614_04290, partial [SAR324 cluster bacterium]|nr:hypothetical protein [SAR324 cluster bacterium]
MALVRLAETAGGQRRSGRPSANSRCTTILNNTDLVICLKLLNVISLSDEESEQRIHSILKTHLGHQYEEREAEAVQVLSTLSDEEKVNRTKASFSQLQEEEESIKKEIL